MKLFIGKDWMKQLQCEDNNKINFFGILFGLEHCRLASDYLI